MSNEQQHNEELVSKYVGQVAALSLKAESGENVSDKVRAVIDRASKDFANANGDSELGNLKWMIAQLQILVHATSQQAWAQTTLEFAVELARDKMKNRGDI